MCACVCARARAPERTAIIHAQCHLELAAATRCCPTTVTCAPTARYRAWRGSFPHIFELACLRRYLCGCSGHALRVSLCFLSCPLSPPRALCPSLPIYRHRHRHTRVVYVCCSAPTTTTTSFTITIPSLFETTASAPCGCELAADSELARAGAPPALEGVCGLLLYCCSCSSSPTSRMEV